MTKKLWLTILQDPKICYWDVIGSNFNAEDVRTRYDILSDGNGHIFESQFPFSFIFFHSIETMRPEAEKLGRYYHYFIFVFSLYSFFFFLFVHFLIFCRVEDSTPRLFKSVYPTLPVDLITSSQLDNYMHDFIHMRVKIIKK